MSMDAQLVRQTHGEPASIPPGPVHSISSHHSTRSQPHIHPRYRPRVRCSLLEPHTPHPPLDPRQPPMSSLLRFHLLGYRKALRLEELTHDLNLILARLCFKLQRVPPVRVSCIVASRAAAEPELSPHMQQLDGSGGGRKGPQSRHSSLVQVAFIVVTRVRARGAHCCSSSSHSRAPGACKGRPRSAAGGCCAPRWHDLVTRER
jgi:hypothetical protein